MCRGASRAAIIIIPLIATHCRFRDRDVAAAQAAVAKAPATAEGTDSAASGATDAPQQQSTGSPSTSPTLPSTPLTAQQPTALLLHAGGRVDPSLITALSLVGGEGEARLAGAAVADRCK